MTRRGYNPLKRLPPGRKLRGVTALTVVHIPSLEGHWSHGLDILKLCIDSMRTSTAVDFDLVVFDNGSCEEVRSWLLEMLQKEKVHYLFISGENIGKAAALNVLFGAAQGRYVAYSDSDVFFYDGWLEESIRVLETFDRAGIVSGRPWRPLNEDEMFLLDSNEALLQKMDGIEIEKGNLIPQEHLREHAESIATDVEAVLSARVDDLRIAKSGVRAFGYGSHFQYVTTKRMLDTVGNMEVGDTGLSKQERLWDEKIIENRYLRLSLDRPYVKHLGNYLGGEEAAELEHLTGEHIPVSGNTTGAGFLERTVFFLAKVRLFRKIFNKLQLVLYEGLNLK